MRRSLGIDPQPSSCCWWPTISSSRGSPTLLARAARLRGRGGRCSCWSSAASGWAAGGEPAARLGLADAVRFVGPVDDVLALLRRRRRLRPPDHLRHVQPGGAGGGGLRAAGGHHPLQRRRGNVPRRRRHPLDRRAGRRRGVGGEDRDAARSGRPPARWAPPPGKPPCDTPSSERGRDPRTVSRRSSVGASAAPAARWSGRAA